MLYNKPYGAAGADDPYINGDPSIGRAGSIPPAAAIEYPQREIANLIADAAMTPSNSDLHQLAKAVQSGKLMYATDTGSANIVALTCTPAVTALQLGMVFVTKAATTNSGPSVAIINGITAPIVHSNDRTPLLAFDINVGQMLALAFDGTSFQLVWSGASSKASQGVLQANYDFYVNTTTGNDTTLDGTTAVVSGAHGPFKTIGKAMVESSRLNANGYNITIHVADGTYSESVSQQFVVNGGLILIGNTPTPANCLITTATPSCIGLRGSGVQLTVRGFKLVNTGPAGSYCMVSQANSQLNYSDMDFGSAPSAHILCDSGSVGADGNYRISGNSVYHVVVQSATFVLTPSGTNVVTINAGVSLTAFCFVTGLGFLRANTRTTFSGTVSAGSKYLLTLNAVIDTGGAGVNFFPGTTAGSAATGGVYG